jgi:predicted cytidylate kinase
MKKHIITITGDLASGKSTVTKMLKDDLGYLMYKNGEYFRKLAIENNMSVTEFNKYVENHPEIDRQIELSAEVFAKDHDNVIIDARLGWYSVPYSFKIYLKVDKDEAAKRAFYDCDRKASECFCTLEEYKEDLQRRDNLENERYFKLYGVRKNDMSNYDLVIDTTSMTPEEVKEKIIIEYNKWLEI